MNGLVARESVTLPNRRWCKTAEKKKWAAFQAEVTNGPFGDAFARTLVVLVSSLISPDTGVVCQKADMEGFFEAEYLCPDDRMFLLQFVYEVARNQPTGSTKYTFYNISRDAWKAFLSPVLSDSLQITAFYLGATPAGRIKPVLEQLGLATSIEEIYALQHRLGPVLASEVIVPFKAPLPISIPEMGEVFAKALDIRQMIGSVDLPQGPLVVLAMSHFGDLRQQFLQEWSDTFHAEQLSSTAMQQFWVAPNPKHGLVLLVSMLLRHYYVFGKVVVHDQSPELLEDLSPKSFFLLTEATASYAMVFGVDALLYELFPKFRYLTAKLSPARQLLWEEFWQANLPDLTSRQRRELGVSVSALFEWWSICMGNRHRGRMGF